MVNEIFDFIIQFGVNSIEIIIGVTVIWMCAKRKLHERKTNNTIALSRGHPGKQAAKYLF
jgi:hypothetical protein